VYHSNDGNRSKQGSVVIPRPETPVGRQVKCHIITLQRNLLSRFQIVACEQTDRLAEDFRRIFCSFQCSVRQKPRTQPRPDKQECFWVTKSKMWALGIDYCPGNCSGCKFCLWILPTMSLLVSNPGTVHNSSKWQWSKSISNWNVMLFGNPENYIAERMLVLASRPDTKCLY
jgi:hypothetical protein